MCTQKVFKKIFLSLLSLIFFITSAATASFDIYDHIKNFKAALTVSPSGDVVIEETLVVYVGTKSAKNSSKVIYGFIRELPSRGTHLGFSGMIIESISCDETPINYELFYSEPQKIAIKIKSLKPLNTGQQYTYHIKYHYPGLINFENNDGKSLFIDWQMTLKKGLGILNSEININLPNETQIHSYKLLQLNHDGKIHQILYPANYLFQDAPSFTTWELNDSTEHSRKIKAEQSKKTINLSIQNQNPNDMPVAIHLDFENPIMHQALNQNYLSEKLIFAKPEHHFITSVALVFISYFLALKALAYRQKELQKKHEQYLANNTYNNLTSWQKNYLKNKSVDINILEALFAEWHYQSIITLKKDGEDSLVLSMRPDQRKKLSAGDALIARSFFTPEESKNAGVWIKKITTTNQLSFYNIVEQLHNVMRAKVSLKRHIPFSTYCFIAVIWAAILISAADIFEIFLKNQDAIPALAISVLVALLLQKIHLDRAQRTSPSMLREISPFGHFSIIGFLISAFYIIELGSYDVFMFFVLCFFFLIWCLQAIYFLYPIQLDKIALQTLARRLEATDAAPKVKASWPMLWAYLKHILIKAKEQELQDGHNNHELSNPFACRYHYVYVKPGSIRNGSGTGGGFGGGGSARGC